MNSRLEMDRSGPNFGRIIRPNTRLGSASLRYLAKADVRQKFGAAGLLSPHFSLSH